MPRYLHEGASKVCTPDRFNTSAHSTSVLLTRQDASTYEITQSVGGNPVLLTNKGDNLASDEMGPPRHVVAKVVGRA